MCRPDQRVPLAKSSGTSNPTGISSITRRSAPLTKPPWGRSSTRGAPGTGDPLTATSALETLAGRQRRRLMSRRSAPCALNAARRVSSGPPGPAVAGVPTTLTASGHGWAPAG
eukprot:6519042-Alexandrium_andersonii.AAC.1